MSEQFKLDLQPQAEMPGIDVLKKSYLEKIGVPYPITAETDEEIRARITQLLTMSKDDARAAVQLWEQERDADLDWQQK